MANIIPDAFKSELLSGTHNFANGGNSFKIALYTDISGFSTSSTAYSSTNEVSSTDTSYTATGQALGSQAVAVASNVAHVDFADEVFSSVTLSAVGAIIYNDTNSDKLVVVLDFGGTKTATNGDFTIQFPAAGASTAILRIA
jgi:carbon monoxide dehydrogenase subunit G